MVREDLVAERIAVESYNEVIRYLGDNDPTTRIAMEQILAKEEEHADDMKKLLETLGKDERLPQVPEELSRSSRWRYSALGVALESRCAARMCQTRGKAV
jgi:ferritin-like protein